VLDKIFPTFLLSRPFPSPRYLISAAQRKPPTPPPPPHSFLPVSRLDEVSTFAAAHFLCPFSFLPRAPSPSFLLGSLSLCRHFFSNHSQPLDRLSLPLWPDMSSLFFCPPQFPLFFTPTYSVTLDTAPSPPSLYYAIVFSHTPSSIRFFIFPPPGAFFARP